MTDKELAQAAITDDVVFADMYRRHAPALTRAALRVLRSREDADDAVQDVFVNIRGKLATFRGDSALATWLTRSVLNRALMALRRRKIVDFVEVSDGLATFDTRLESLPAKEQLERAMAVLDDREQAVVHACLVLGMTTVEYAEQCGCSPAAAKTRLFRVREKLKVELLRTAK